MSSTAKWAAAVVMLVLLAVVAFVPLRGLLRDRPHPDESAQPQPCRVPSLTGTPVSAWLPAGEIVQGAFVPRGPDLANHLNAFATDAGKRPAVVAGFTSWASDFPTDFVEQAKEFAPAVLIAWEPWRDPSKASDPTMRLATIAGGDHDAYIRRWARAARDTCMPIFLRFGPEMNGDWAKWSENANGNHPGDFTAAWRHVHDLFVQEGATNAMWTWSPNVLAYGVQPLEGLYPGDQYVDWVGLSGFNWGTTNRLNTWKTFDQVYDETLAAVARITDRPVMLAEVASAEDGGDKGEWITGMFASLPAHAQVRGLVWFNEKKEADWRIQSSTAAANAYRAGLADPRYLAAESLADRFDSIDDQSPAA